MLSYGKIRIKSKLQVIIMAVVAPALLLSCAAIVTYDLVLLRDSTQKDLKTQAEIMGADISAALGFGDQEAAEQDLAGLRAKPDIVAAYVYSSDGALFASYRRDGGGNRQPTTSLHANEIRSL